MGKFPPFFIDELVRDSEVDSQGGVSNFKLMEYFQHARHEYFRQQGYSLKNFIKEEIDPVVVEAHLKFAHFLTHGDNYRITVNPVRGGVKYFFLCGLYRLPELKLCAKAIIVVAVSKGGSLLRDNILHIEDAAEGRNFNPAFKDIPDKI